MGQLLIIKDYLILMITKKSASFIRFNLKRFNITNYTKIFSLKKL